MYSYLPMGTCMVVLTLPKQRGLIMDNLITAIVYCAAKEIIHGYVLPPGHPWRMQAIRVIKAVYPVIRYTV